MKEGIHMKVKYEAEIKDCNECKLYRNCICSHDGMLASFKATRVGDTEEYGIDQLPCYRRPCPAEIEGVNEGVKSCYTCGNQNPSGNKECQMVCSDYRRWIPIDRP
jgi:hypothetical protein